MSIARKRRNEEAEMRSTTPMISGDEQDALATPARYRSTYRPGERREIRRRTHKRDRRAGRQIARDSREG
jgi:hypothetical protein